jgi:hypothetical protein
MNVSLILFFKLKTLAFVKAEPGDSADLAHLINIIIVLSSEGMCICIILMGKSNNLL